MKIIVVLVFFFVSCSHNSLISEKKISSSNLCLEVDASIENAKNYFLTSTYSALERLHSGKKPIQVDLYIVAHYLDFQDKLRFTSNYQEDMRLKQKIANYFIKSFGDKIWEVEGCLPGKVLYGLEKNSLLLKYQRTTFNNYFSSLISEAWKNKGFGECFSLNINRTYGGDLNFCNKDKNAYCTDKLKCTTYTRENTIKFSNYLALLDHDEKSFFSKFNYSLINKEYDEIKLSNNMDERDILYFDIESELWLSLLIEKNPDIVSIKTTNRSNKFVTSSLYVAKNNLEQTRRAKFNFEPMLYVYLNYAHRKKELVYYLIKNIIHSQNKNGSFSSRSTYFNNDKDNVLSHNTKATPTYYSLFALDKFQKIYCR